MKKVILLAALSTAFLLTYSSLKATTYTFTGTGNWTDATRWSPGIPPNPLTNGNDIIIDGTATLTTSQNINNGATVTISINGTLDFGDGNLDNFFNNGTFTNNGTFNLNDGIFTNSNVASNSGNITVASASDGFRIDDGTFTNNGTITNNAGATILIDTDGGNNGTLTNNSIINNFGSISNFYNLNNAGTLTNNTGGSISNGNQGGDRLTNAGTLVNNGTITNYNTNSLDNTGGIVSGTGSISGGGFTNTGTLSPGSTGTIGTFTISGGFKNTSTGTVLMDIQGSPTARDQIVLIAVGSSTLDGTLTVSQIGTGSILLNNPFILINGAFGGNFSTVNLPGGPSVWTIDSTSPNYGIVYNSSSPLPIELISFVGKQHGNTIILRWETASEKSNAYIALERSRDGIEFAEIAQVEGYGTTTEPKQYSWTDERPFAGINYYRLKQVDFDGKYEYHPVIAVEFDGKTQEGIRIYPTDVKDHLQMVLDTPTSEDATLLVVDLSGRVRHRRKLSAGISQDDLTLPDLPKGQYYLTLQSNYTVKTAPFVKL